MTEQAEIARNRRRRQAAPGGFHDKLVRSLAVALPMGVGVLVAVMLLAPLSPRGEISFLLDRNKVDVVKDRVRVESAMYRGQDNAGRPFSITAGNAVQHAKANPVVTLNDLVARLLLDQGPAMLTAGTGNYRMDSEQVRVFGPVVFTAADGYRMTAEDVDIDIPAKTMTSRGRVDGRIPAGTFSADRIITNLDTRTVTLDGNAKLRMTPGKMDMPK